MKKALAIVLIAVVCLSFAACGGGSSAAEKALIGEWKSLEEGDVIEFKEDGEGEWYGESFEWEYDKQEKEYSMKAIGMSVTFEIVEEDGIRSLTPLGMFSPWIYYHVDDIDKVAEKD